MHEMLHNLQTLLNRFNKKCSHKFPGLKVQGCSGRCTGIRGDENWCAFSKYREDLEFTAM